MPPSTTVQLPCPNCGATVEFTLWTVLDLGGNPDLRRRFLAGEINVLRCPACGEEGFLPFPLAIHDSEAQRVLFFIPDDPRLSAELLGQLVNELGSRLMAELRAPYPDYLFSPVILRDPSNLTNALAPKGAMRQPPPPPEAREVQQVLAALPSDLRDALKELRNSVSSPEEFEAAMKAHPDLRAALEKALAVEAEPGPEGGPSELESILHQLEQPARLSDMPRRVELCRQALCLVSRADDPSLWAWLHGELAISLSQSPLGERAENLEQAIRHYQQALEVLTRQTYPKRWGSIQNNLANAYRSRIRGERGENLEQAIHHFQQALEVYTRQAYPERWAGTQNNLATAYSDRIRGERGENLEQAITHYQQALDVYTRQAYPEQWAMTQNNLAAAYAKRLPGKRAENLEQAIRHYQQALEVRTRQAYPKAWADTQNNLATAYRSRIRGERGENLEQAIHHYQQALEVYHRQAYPEDWAMTQNNLANAYRSRIRGERAENLEQAIHHFQQALDVYTRQAYPERWAGTQNNLATAYSDRIRGERAENLEQAIHHFQQALEVYTRQAYSEQWARTQNSLAAAYANRIQGERAENLEQAIRHYQQALEVYTRQAYPEGWAMTQNNLATAYSDRIRGERAENLEQAIHNFQQALDVYTRQAYPERWAGTQNNLAAAYAKRIRGERADNLERTIQHCQQALDVYTRPAYPEDWAMTQNNLGEAYRNRIRGERGENLEQAIRHYQQVLEVYTRQAYPERWAGTQNNLANAYLYRIRGERGENLEQAVHHFQRALEVYTRQTYPKDWAMTQNNLANAYSDRIRGERAENLEQAIQHFQHALEVYTRQAYPEDWAGTQNNLANAYSDRIRGERGENLEQAIHHFQQALAVFTRQAYPEDWAMAQNNLANAYSDRIRGERAENLEQAIYHYQQALEVRARQAYPERWATTQNSLANVYQGRIRGERAENLEQAIHHYQQALEVLTRQAYPEDWAGTQSNLGEAYRTRTRGERAENLEQAIHHFQQALAVFTHQGYPIEHQQTTRNLADLYFDDGRWAEAAAVYGDAIAAGEHLLAEAFTSAGHQAEAGRSARLYANAAYALVQEKQIAQALNALEAGKTRLLRDALAIARAAALPPPQRDRFEQARDRLLVAQAELGRRDTPTPYTEREGQLIAARDEFNALAEALELGSHPLCAEGIQAAVPNDETVLVAPCATQHGGLAFIVSQQQGIQAVPLPELTTKRLSLLLTGTEEGQVESGWLGDYFAYQQAADQYRGALNAAVSAKLAPQAILDALEAPAAALENARHTWHATLAHTLDTLCELLWKPLTSTLAEKDAQRLVLVPQGALFPLPLHAVPFPDGRLVLETYSVAYAPSATVWAEVQTRPRSPLEATPLPVANPTGDLPYTPSEALAFAHLLELSDAAILWENQATKAQLLGSLPGKILFHYSGHAAYDWLQPEESALLLTGGDTLTLAEIQASHALAGNQLTVLSACETGLTEITRGLADEYIGLPAAFLEAGAAAVVASLWSVADISTSLLMIRFYQHLTGRGTSRPLPPAEALRGAQLWLRGASKAELLAQVDWLEKLWREHNRRHPIGSPAYRRGYLNLLLHLPRARQFIEARPDDPPFAAPFWWAGFQAVGNVL